MNQQRIPPTIITNLQKLGILCAQKRLIPIHTTPDYNHGPYKGLETAHYFLKDSWDFSLLYDSVLSVDVGPLYIFHYDHLEDLQKELPISLHNKSFEAIVNEAYLLNADILFDNSFSNNLDEFRIQHVDTDYIDNVQKRWYYAGSFLGDSSSMNPDDWQVMCLADVTATGLQIHLDLAKSLLAEAYQLYMQLNVRLSYFLLYIAFENFMLLRAGKGQLKQKLRRMANHSLLKNNKTVEDLCSFEEKFSENRHNIAHGRDQDSVSFPDLEDAFCQITDAMLHLESLSC